LTLHLDELRGNRSTNLFVKYLKFLFLKYLKFMESARNLNECGNVFAEALAYSFYNSVTVISFTHMYT
jgi:hypothetical protein